MLKILSRELTSKQLPRWQFKPGVQLNNQFRAVQSGVGEKATIVHEFIATDSFAKAFYERQQYEVDAGRLEEPILYTPLYQITEDATLPRNVPVQRLGPTGVVFDEIQEGGEVKFLTVGQSNFSVPIKQYAVGVEYSKALTLFNELWSLAEVEREMGVAYNALLNHLHFFPIIASSAYGAGNQVVGGSLSFDSNATAPEKYLRTLEEAITEATNDTTNPRPGPYALLVATNNLFTAERALTAVDQQGFTRQSSAIGLIQTVIAYNGWTGTRGNIATTYGGVTAGMAFLVDLRRRARNFRSYVKQPLQRTTGNPDVSRFILEQTVWDTWFGVYADPVAAVEQIWWP
jgi:hypothetical protein